MTAYLNLLRDKLNSLVDFDGVAPASCVDLVNEYLVDYAKGPRVGGNAVDIPAQSLRGWRWVANSLTNHPLGGDIVCWRAHVAAVGIGQYGHCAVAVAADSVVLLTVDQGWPLGAPVALVVHSYLGVGGWLTPT